ncbi:MAG TPA: Fe(2+)-trafficking protein [Phycisphaerales bacterium]|nr:Fe(2+)-trafficking protein [Phycisphaerales bacterium]
MDINQRIAQFENMVQADPDNDMAHYSLGNAYAQAQRWNDAATSYLRCIDKNPAMSKAYQLAGDALINAGDHARAVEVLTTGFKSAASRGDRMPQKAMGDLLRKLNAPVPEVATKGPEVAAGTGQMIDPVTGRPGTRMARPPFKGPVGNWIFEHITKETFDAWIAQGTKVINELRLDLSKDEDSALYDKHMREYLGIDDELYQKLQSGG